MNYELGYYGIVARTKTMQLLTDLNTKYIKTVTEQFQRTIKFEDFQMEMIRV